MIWLRTIFSVVCLGSAMIITVHWQQDDPVFWRSLFVYSIPVNLLITIHVMISRWPNAGSSK